MKRKLTAGQTSVSLPIFVQSTASTTGGGLAGLTHSTAGLVAEYRRRGQSAWTTITLAAKTLGTWTSGGIVADGALDGAYELDLPDAVCATGARWVAVRLRGAANMLPVLIEIELDVVDYLTARFGAAAAGDLMGLADGAITAAKFAANAIAAAAIASGAFNDKGNWSKAGDLMGLADGAITAAKFAANAIAAAAIAAGAFNDKGNWSKAGDQMDLINTPNATARQAFATTIEAAILNEADATALLAAIANKVETFLINDGDAVATLTAIAAAVNSAIVAGQIGSDLTTTKASAATAASQATAAATSAASANTAAAAAKVAAESADGKLTAPRLAKIDGAAQAGADNDTLKTISDQIDGIGGGGGGGGGTDWTADERTAIRNALGIPTSGTTLLDPTAGILDTIRDQAVAISAALAGAPVEPTGRIASGGGIVAYIGDDFRVRSGTQLQIPVSDPSGGLYTKLNAIGAGNLAFGASRPDKAAGAISGTIASLATSGSGASQLLLITVEISNCGSGLRPGDDYTYQIEDRQTQGTEVDSFVRIEGSMELRKKVV